MFFASGRSSAEDGFIVEVSSERDEQLFVTLISNDAQSSNAMVFYCNQGERVVFKVASNSYSTNALLGSADSKTTTFSGFKICNHP